MARSVAESILAHLRYLAPGAGAGALTAVCGKIQLYFGELSTMKWIKNATTRPAPAYAPKTAWKL